MYVQVARTPAELDSLADHWNSVSGDVPFRRWEWNRTWWRYYGSGHDLFVLVVYDGSEAIAGLAPWYIEQSAGAGRVIRFLGSGEVCSEYSTLLTAPGRAIEVCDAVADWLATPANHDLTSPIPCQWDLMELTSVDSDDDVLAAMALRFATSDFTVHERPAMPCWQLQLPATWDAYLATLSKPNRRRTRAAAKRLSQPDCACKVVTTNAEFEHTWELLVDFHQRRRRSLNEPGCFASDPFGLFLRDLSHQFLSSGHLNMVWVEIAGRPIAVGLNFRLGGVTYCYQVGIDPDHLAEAPGWLVNTATIQQAIATGQHKLDLLRGNEPYKGHLGARPHPSKELRIVPNRLRSQLWHKAWRTGNTMKDWLKTSLTLAGIRST
jgi:CelD/BcsL family acetyltransferase involved in cellulose biosynthesis